MISKTIGITGGTGFVGHHLAGMLVKQGHRVIIFTRSPKPAKGAISFAVWKPDAIQIDKNAIGQVDAVIHLAGAGVADKRWTAGRKEEIRRSRIEATYFLHKAIQELAPKCTAFVAASATGYYGPDREGLVPFTEDSPPYIDFLANVCKDWEAASLSAADRYRSVVLRTGIVLGRDGGAYPELSGPMAFGIMPILGSGRQVVSWIHIHDLARLYIDALANEQFKGVYNAVAPNPVTHRELMKAIAKAKGGIKIPAPVPPFVLQLIMGDASIEVLKSCTVSSAKTETQGFHFLYPTVQSALKEISS